MIQSRVRLVHIRLFGKIPCLASPFGMVHCIDSASPLCMLQSLVWPVHMEWYKAPSGWPIWNVTMFCPASSFEITQDTNQLIHMQWCQVYFGWSTCYSRMSLLPCQKRWSYILLGHPIWDGHESHQLLHMRWYNIFSGQSMLDSTILPPAGQFMITILPTSWYIFNGTMSTASPSHRLHHFKWYTILNGTLTFFEITGHPI
jgi:hypothetical protein